MSSWIAVDFDGTLAEYHGWDGDNLGVPIKPMVERVKLWIANGQNVKIFTARVGCSGKRSDVSLDNEEFAEHQRKLITQWCVEHIGVPLEVTATKDFAMLELWDDRAIQVRMNTGEQIGFSTRGNNNEISPEQKLWAACHNFIVEQRISCPETISQCDWVIENAYDFIESVCEIVGYQD